MISASIDSIKLSIKRLLWIVIIGLVLSGVTAFPLELELNIAKVLIDLISNDNVFLEWITFVHEGVADTYADYPFVAYGTDWLGFAHIILAILFFGTLKDPLKNVWVVEFGIISSVAIIPFAFLAGSFRGIPIFWRLMDCSFGIVCGSILGICLYKIKQLESLRPGLKL